MSSKSLHQFHFIHYKFHLGNIIKPGRWYSHVCYMSCSYHVPGYDNASNISLKVICLRVKACSLLHPVLNFPDHTFCFSTLL